MILFHGGCQGCTVQKEDIYRCAGCQYFAADWSLPDLHNNRITAAELKRIEIKKVIASRSEKV